MHCLLIIEYNLEKDFIFDFVKRNIVLFEVFTAIHIIDSVETFSIFEIDVILQVQLSPAQEKLKLLAHNKELPMK